MKTLKFVSIRVNSLLKRWITLYKCRAASTNPPFFEKTNPIFPVFWPQNCDLPKNEPKTNPIRTQSNPKRTQTWAIYKDYMNKMMTGASEKPLFSIDIL